MKIQENMAVQYVERGRVLSLLFDLMGTVLSARERRALLLRCGFGLDGPMPFGQVAKTLDLSSPRYARAFYDQAVDKTRQAIPGIVMEVFLTRYTHPRIACHKVRR